MASQVNFYQTFIEELIPSFLKQLKKRMLPNSFYEAGITLMPKPKTAQKMKITE